MKGNPDWETYDTVTDFHQLRLTENFRLPVFFGTSTDYEYETGRFTYTEEEAAAKAKEELDSLLDGLEQKGVQISANHVKIGIQNGSCTAKGTLTVIEKTGQRVPSQILEQPAERTTDTDE